MPTVYMPKVALHSNNGGYVPFTGFLEGIFQGKLIQFSSISVYQHFVLFRVMTYYYYILKHFGRTGSLYRRSSIIKFPELTILQLFFYS